MKTEAIKEIVRKGYGKVARGGGGCCGGDTTEDLARSIGYSDEELSAVAGDANLGLGCGNPTALASLKEGEVVLDLGSGAGFDCFLAAQKVGPAGRVIGVDMTPEMIEKAEANAAKSAAENVEFRLGEIESLPLEDNSVDVVISNCVINLSADKQAVFREIHRVLKPGGRIAISDIALLEELPEKIRQSIEAYVGCVGGAILVDEYREILQAAGLGEITITVKGGSSCIDEDTTDPMGRALLESIDDVDALEGCVANVYVEGRK